MKTSTLLTAGLYVLLAFRSLAAMAEDPRGAGPYNGMSYNSAPNRGVLGLPIPRQWSGARTSGMNRGYSPAGYRQSDYSANCPNGQCTTGYRAQPENCANGQCSTGACANGQCANGCCVNGQCLTGECLNGQCPNGRCQTGNYGTSPYRNDRSSQGAQSDWSPRSSRSTIADPFRRSGDRSDRDVWTQRTARPVLDPLDDAFNSRYDRDDLDLKSEYFGNGTGERDSRSPSRTRSNSGEWNGQSRRSMEAPAESFSGVARF